MHQLQLISQQIDTAWLPAIHSYTSPLLDWLAWLLSTVSWMGACWWLLCVVLWVRGYRLLAAQIVIAMVFAAVAAEGLKHLSHRLRPSDVMPQFVHLPLPNLPDSRFTFPSGHVALAAAAVTAAILSPHRNVAWWLIPVVLLLGWARLYQGVHWPSDVLGGLVVGILAAGAAKIVSVALKGQLLLRDRPLQRTAAEQHSESAH